MGKGRRTKGNKGGPARKRGKWDGAKGGNTWSQDAKAPGTDGYTDFSRENAAFEKYYKLQNIVDEKDWDSFMTHLRRPLPTTFRITGTRNSDKMILNRLEDYYFGHLAGLKHEVVTSTTVPEVAEGADADASAAASSAPATRSELAVEEVELEPPSPLPWYPNKLAWTMTASRTMLRKHPELNRFHHFIVKMNAQGNISRQEAVSMIPALLLDVQSHHAVLDMCAAPGSKTTQMIEMLHSSVGSQVPTGIVIANDADYKRCYTLVHQTKRIESPNFMVVNEDASMFPSIFVSSGERNEVLRYDRVLCDVPCSGDGTLRKNPLLWNRWTPNMGIGLHDLQFRIAARGVQLAKVGARMVYSTCSLNPVENEAVVAQLLRKFKGCLEIVDVAAELPELRRNPGINTWVVTSKSAEDVYRTIDDIPAEARGRILPSMFPPTPEEAEWMNLPRTLRLLPFHQNTGGFYVAVLRKTAPTSTKEAKQMKRAEALAKGEKPVAGDEDAGEKMDTEDDAPIQAAAPVPGDALEEAGDDGESKDVTQKGAKKTGYKEDPFLFNVAASEGYKKLKEYFGLSDDFPKDELLVRSTEGRTRNIYLVSPLIKEIINKNSSSLRIVNSGLRVFCRSESTTVACPFRLTQEGINVVLPFMSKRVVPMPASDLHRLLQEDTPSIAALTAEGARALSALDEGCIAFSIAAGSPSLAPPKADGSVQPLLADVRLMGWRGRTNLRCLVGRQERLAYKLLLGLDATQADDEEIAYEAAKKTKRDGKKKPAGGAAGEADEEMPDAEGEEAAAPAEGDEGEEGEEGEEEKDE